MTETLEARLLVDCRCTLGEGVVWNPARRRVYWTDIKGGALWSCDENGAAVSRLALDGALCAFAFSDDGRILGAFDDGLCWLDPLDGRRTLFEPYQPDRAGTRMNDGALDRQGRFVVGGIDEAGLEPVTPVWSVERGEVRTILEDVRIANSIAFSPEGERMYFADTPTAEIRAYDYDATTGTPGEAGVFARPEPPAKPDGSTVDRDGALWNAEFGGSGVQRWLADGTPDLRVAVPVPNVTCCTIGGRGWSRMFITTARIEMDAAALADLPEAGGLYVVDLPVTGLPAGTYKR